MKLSPSTIRLLAVTVFLTGCSTLPGYFSQRQTASDFELPPSIDDLRRLNPVTGLVFERPLPDGKGYSAYLVSYHSAGLKVYAMVAVPKMDAPEGGYPILVAAHGTHPNPPQYGFTAQGHDLRPGDYYRPVPEVYTAEGFLVVMPDYRGHNISEGEQYAKGYLASNYYTEDVLYLIAGIDQIKEGNSSNIFMWGHSLGGEVALRALLADHRVKAASLWSPVSATIWDQAYFYSRYTDPMSDDSNTIPKKSIDNLRSDIDALGKKFDWQAREPSNHLKYLRTPILIHQAVGDAGAPYYLTLSLAKGLYLEQAPYTFYTYEGTDHFFSGKQRALAVKRDAEFFRSFLAE